MKNCETELKFAVQPQAITAAIACLTQLPHQHFRPVRLTNIYFETPTNTLRQWDMGLRIRGCDLNYEMTLKGAGKDIGGLFQRPEFNVFLDKPKLDINLFTKDVWPDECVIADLQSQLQPLFRTDFAREKWLITYNNSEIEAVLDQGEIAVDKANGEKSCLPICEFELELKSGALSDLLAVAKKFVGLAGLRLASQSKAARGYYLIQGSPQATLPTLYQQLDSSLSLYTQLALIMQQWQALEEAWLMGLNEAPQFIVMTLDLLETLLTENRNSVPDFVQNIALSELISAIANSESHADVLCFSALWLESKLNFTQWMVALSLLEEKCLPH